MLLRVVGVLVLEQLKESVLEKTYSHKINNLTLQRSLPVSCLPLWMDQELQEMWWWLVEEVIEIIKFPGTLAIKCHRKHVHPVVGNAES